jgi:hypothetical protein
LIKVKYRKTRREIPDLTQAEMLAFITQKKFRKMVNSAVEIIFQQLCELCKNTIVTGNDLGCLQVYFQ